MVLLRLLQPMKRCAFLHCYYIAYLLLGLRLRAELVTLSLVEGFSLSQLQLSSSPSSGRYCYCHNHDTSSSSCQRIASNSPTVLHATAGGRDGHDNPARIMGQEIPLMDVLNKSEFSNKMIQPLPSRQYPADEMRTLFLYGMPIQVPVHQAIIDDAKTRRLIGTGGTEQLACFGHLAYKPNNQLVGAIGCAAQILPIPLSSKTSFFAVSDDNTNVETEQQQQGEERGVNAVLCRGWYRFIVREVIQTIPFAVAIVDELVDDDIDNIRNTIAAAQVKVDDDSSDDDSDSDDDEDDDDDDDDYADLTPDQLEKRLVQGMRDYVQQQLEISNREMTPLELSILQDGAAAVSAQRQAAEEMAAVLDVFIQYTVDESPVAPAERYYMLAFMAAEMTNLDNDMRRDILVVTNSVQRLRMLLAAVEDKVGMARARQMAKSITAKSDEEEKDLKVGKPQLPSWALQIRKGMRIEYYWNEEYEWCVCEVVKEPVLHENDNELMLTVSFEDDDDRTRQLPFRADEKARWRPARRQ